MIAAGRRRPRGPPAAREAVAVAVVPWDLETALPGRAGRRRRPRGLLGEPYPAVAPGRFRPGRAGLRGRNGEGRPGRSRTGLGLWWPGIRCRTSCASCARSSTGRGATRTQLASPCGAGHCCRMSRARCKMSRPCAHVLSFLSLSLIAARQHGPRRADPAVIDAYLTPTRSLYIDLHREPGCRCTRTDGGQASPRACARSDTGQRPASSATASYGVLRNGGGPTVMLRNGTSTPCPSGEDSRPRLREPRSGSTTTRASKSFMHSAGTTCTVTAWIGAATVLARQKAHWRGHPLFARRPSPSRQRGLARRALLCADGRTRASPKPDVACPARRAELPAVRSLHARVALANGELGGHHDPGAAASRLPVQRPRSYPIAASAVVRLQSR